MPEEEEVKLVFPELGKNAKSAVGMDSYGMIGGQKVQRIFDVDKILDWFKKLEVKEIELWMETALKAGKVISLIVSAEGKGGVKVTLTPKKQE